MKINTPDIQVFVPSLYAQNSLLCLNLYNIGQSPEFVISGRAMLLKYVFRATEPEFIRPFPMHHIIERQSASFSTQDVRVLSLSLGIVFLFVFSCANTSLLLLCIIGFLDLEC